MKLSREEFEHLALEHMDMLYRIARRLTRDVAKAEDLVQETYLRAFRASGSFDLQEFGIRPWLVRILHNLHFSASQRDQRGPFHSQEARLEESPAPVPAVQSNGENLGELYEGMDEQLVHAIEELPTEYQTVLLLWAVDDLSYKEIATACDIPIGTVMSRLHRARQKLTEKLRDYATKERLIGE